MMAMKVNNMDFKKLSVDDRIDFIADLDVPVVNPSMSLRSLPLKMQPLTMQPLNADKGNLESAVVIGNNVLSFVAGLDPQLKQDVKDSVLLAQLAAAKKYPNKDTHHVERYHLFSDVMTACGWTTTNDSIHKVTDLQQKFTMDQVALEIIASVVGPNKAILEIVGIVFGALAKTPKALSLFENAAKGIDSGNFQILPCFPTVDDEVIMIKTGMQFSSAKRVSKVLFWEWSSNEVNLYAAASSVTLNRKLYAGLRDKVAEKLGTSAMGKVENIDI